MKWVSPLSNLSPSRGKAPDLLPLTGRTKEECQTYFQESSRRIRRNFFLKLRDLRALLRKRIGRDGPSPFPLPRNAGEGNETHASPSPIPMGEGWGEGDFHCLDAS